jgi:hypothetical protein
MLCENGFVKMLCDGFDSINIIDSNWEGYDNPTPYYVPSIGLPPPLKPSQCPRCGKRNVDTVIHGSYASPCVPH